MPDGRLPLLRGRISGEQHYASPSHGGTRLECPSRDPLAHRASLLHQLETIEQQVAARPPGTRDETATRELIAIEPAPGSRLAASPLADKRTDVRLISTDSKTGTVLIDAADPVLQHLRDKIDAFADGGKVRSKVLPDGRIKVQRKSEDAVAPIESLRLATFGDRLLLELAAFDPAAGRGAGVDRDPDVISD